MSISDSCCYAGLNQVGVFMRSWQISIVGISLLMLLSNADR